MRSSFVFVLLILLLGGLAAPRVARAHTGPPFPIVVDRPVSDYAVSVWTDPDVGEATFFVMLEPSAGVAAPMGVSEVDVWVRPASGRLPKAVYRAEPEQARGHLQFAARPELDAAEMWVVGVDIRFADGSSHAILSEVEATPPGGGPWGTVIFLAPILIFGGLWAMAMLRKRRRTGIRCVAAPTNQGTGLPSSPPRGLPDRS